MSNRVRKPPKTAGWLLEKIINRYTKYTALGDYEEEFHSNLRDKGYPHAAINYWSHIFAVLPSFITEKLSGGTAMFRNYLKIAYRNIKRSKVYSFINISGLAVGMTCFILIMLFVQYELSYDTFHEDLDRIYRVQSSLRNNTSNVMTFGPLATALLSECPEVLSAVRIEHRDEYKIALKYNNNSFYERGFYVDEGFFDIFSYSMIKGDPRTALAQPFSIVITEEIAKKYFGDEDPLGKTLTIIEDESYDAKITGVIKDVPENSHLQFDFLMSMLSLNVIYESEDFGKKGSYSDFLTYLKLKDNTDPKLLEAKLPDLTERFDNRRVNNYFLMPLRDIHLKSIDNFEIHANTDLLNINFLTIIAYLILMIACFNYMNLATAKALKRSKEIGVRKVIGAFKKQLIAQFLYESSILSAIALIIAVIVTVIILPAFNVITDRAITFNIIENKILLVELIMLVLAVGLFSGIYPAIYVTSFQPIKVLGGKSTRISGKTGLRNFFVAAQFCVSIVLIAGTLVIGRQLNFIKTKNIGYDRENVLAIQLRDDIISNNIEPLKAELLKNPGIQYVSSSSHIPNRITWGGTLQSRDDETVRVRSGTVDYDYVDLFNIEITQGRKFSRDFASDESGAFLLSEKALEMVGWESPIGMECSHFSGTTGKVVGIFKDFHFRSMHQQIQPLYLVLNPDRVRVLFIKIAPGEIQESVKYIEDTFELFNPTHPFDYFFLDDSFNDMYKSEQKFGTIFNCFSTIAIFIACLGLFGLIAYSVEMRSKEIGIRKVLGASIPVVFNLVTKEFLYLVIFANIIALPAAYLLLKNWLTNFAYNVEIGWDVFLLSGLIIIIISLVTVSYQSIKAACINPVDSLRYE